MKVSKIVSLKNREFAAVYNNRRSKADRMLILYIRRNQLDFNRLGISVSKKIGNSVVRHRFCRLVRESYRLHQHELKSGYDIVVIARPNVVGVKRQIIEDSFLKLCGIHHILLQEDAV